MGYLWKIWSYCSFGIFHDDASLLTPKLPTLSLRKAIRTLEGACEQLCAALAPAKSHTLECAFVPCPSQCPALHGQFFDMTAFYGTLLISGSYADCSWSTYPPPDMLIGKPQGLSVIELAHRKAILKLRNLRKVLRALATRHIFREGTPHFNALESIYTSELIPINLCSSAQPTFTPIIAYHLPLSTSPRPQTSCYWWLEWFTRHPFSLPDTLRDSQFGHSNDPSKSAFMYHPQGQMYRRHRFFNILLPM